MCTKKAPPTLEGNDEMLFHTDNVHDLIVDGFNKLSRAHVLTKCICPSYTIFVKRLPKPITFQWDEGNKDKNKKHGLENTEIEERFSIKRQKCLSITYIQGVNSGF